jgi:uncharacterized membrane protein YesL
VRTLRLIGRGFSDTLEHLLPFTLLTLAWWLGVLLVVPAPAVTIALTAMTDPRRAVERPDWRDAWTVARGALRRGWGLALLTVPFVLVLAANLATYGTSESRWSLLAPLWTVLLLLAVAVTLGGFAIAGLTERPALLAAKQAAILVGARPLRALGLSLVTLLLVAVGGALVVPLVLFVPALIAAIVNRLVLDGLGLPVQDPLAPTEERVAEERRRADASRFGP